MIHLVLAASLLAAVTTGEPLQSRTIKYGDKDIAVLNTRLRYTTLIILPAGDPILDFLIGDQDYWRLEGNQNFAYLKPGKLGAETSVTLITASGTIYSFVAREVGEHATPDVKVFVERADESIAMRPVGASPRFVAAEEHATLQRAVEALETREGERRADFAVNYPLTTDFHYQFDRNRKPFLVDAVWHDNTSTYIRSRSQEKPALYELQDGAPALVDFQLNGDVYVVPKVITEGYLALGKKRLVFRQAH